MKQGWEYKTIDDCFHYIKNGANIKQDKLAEGLPITRIETLSNGVFNRDRLGYANVFDKNKYLEYIMEDGDLLMSHINSKQYIGRTVLYNKCGDECIIHGMNLLRLKATLDILMPKYAVIYFQCIKFKSDVAKIRKDAVNQSSMAISDLKKINIPVPPLTTQQSIVSELDTLSQIIADYKEQLADYDKLEQSIFYDMFGDPVKNEKGWEVKKLGEMCEIITKGTTPTTVGYKFENEGINFIKVECFENGILNPEKVAHITEQCHESLKRSQLKENDILICIAGATVGKLAFVTKDILPANTNQACCIIRLLSSFRESKSYIFFILQSDYIKNFINSLKKGVAQPNLTLDHVRNFQIPNVPIPLQQQFASKIESIEQMKADTKAALQDAELLFQSRMDYYFNG